MDLVLLFDLDGTLTDSREGIVKSVRYALEKLSLPIPPEETLLRFIGPPLEDSFQRCCGLTEAGRRRPSASTGSATTPSESMKTSRRRVLPNTAGSGGRRAAAWPWPPPSRSISARRSVRASALPSRWRSSPAASPGRA